MRTYKYETHLHTAESSKCAKTPAAEYIPHFKKLGYAGIFVTDHFFNGNTTVPKDLAWEERVELFCQGYEAAAVAGRKQGLDVFFGWEYGYGWAHFLIYGLGKDWLLANPDQLSWGVVEYFQRVHEAGGYITHAHPFRERVDIVNLIPDHVDAIEVINGGRSDICNQRSLDYARGIKLPQTAGTDIHSFSPKRRCGMIFPRRLKDGRDFMQAVLNGEGTLFDETIP